MQSRFILPGFILSILIINISGCSSGGSSGPPPDPCSGITISVSATVTNTSGTGISNGSISATATGSSGFTYSINGGAFQSTGDFTGLATGNYTITAKNSNGCTGSASFTVNSNNPCSSITFTVGGNTVVATPCLATPNGSITVTTSGGGSGFTYNLSGGAFQSSPTFNNLAAGTYTVGAKESGGCVKTANVTITAATAGTLFAAVKTIVGANCAISGCHSGSSPTGGLDFTQDCIIVANAARIKVRAVDQANSINQMPQPPNPALSAANQQAIINWVNAGGKYTD